MATLAPRPALRFRPSRSAATLYPFGRSSPAISPESVVSGGGGRAAGPGLRRRVRVLLAARALGGAPRCARANLGPAEPGSRTDRAARPDPSRGGSGGLGGGTGHGKIRGRGGGQPRAARAWRPVARARLALPGAADWLGRRQVLRPSGAPPRLVVTA